MLINKGTVVILLDANELVQSIHQKQKHVCPQTRKTGSMNDVEPRQISNVVTMKDTYLKLPRRFSITSRTKKMRIDSIPIM